MTQNLLPCVYGKTGCAAYQDGFCKALSDTRFKDRVCPFYKTKQQKEADIAASRKRLKELGAEGLIEKYGG